MMLMKDELKAAAEAILFVHAERVEDRELAALLELELVELQELMEEMIADYQTSRRGIQLLKLDGGYILASKPEYAEIISRMLKPAHRRLSSAALETLAIIAYRQPVTRSEIEQIRGVKSDRIITNLLERGIICDMGQRPGPGHPTLYGTTHEFLRLFGINTLQELPPLLESGSEEESLYERAAEL